MSRKRDKSKKIPSTSKPTMARDVPWYLVAIALAILVLSVYWQVGRHEYVNFDDNQYVYQNPQVLKGLTSESISWAFTTFHGDNWYPLTWLSYMADIQCFGLNAGWQHRVNVMLHLANTVLLFLVLRRMSGGMWQSAFVAALFGVHPLHVESVAWVAARKDVLSTLFWMLTVGAYLRYVRCPNVGRYLPVAVFLALGLMSKPMLVTLPFVLLLLDVWPLGRAPFVRPAGPVGPVRPVGPVGPELKLGAYKLGAYKLGAYKLGAYGYASRRLVWEKVPLFGMAAMSCAITYLVQAQSGTISRIPHLGLESRIGNAVVSYAFYLWKTVWPSSLAVYYPHPASIQAGIPAWEIAGSAALICGLTVLALGQRHRRPYVAVGWLWYLGTLVPVIGLVQTGSHAMADRFTYVPLIGIFIAIAWGIPALLSRWRFGRLALTVCGAAVVVALSAAAWKQAGYWRDTVTLLSRAVAVTDRNWLAMNNLGDTYFRLGQYQRALGCFQEALRMKPDYIDALHNVGVAYQALGQHQQAVGYLQETVRVEPEYTGAWRDLGDSYLKLGQPQEAIRAYREALRITPDDADTWNLLGVSYGMLGQYEQAAGCFREALRIKPDHASARDNLAIANAKLGQSR